MRNNQRSQRERDREKVTNRFERISRYKESEKRKGENYSNYEQVKD